MNTQKIGTILPKCKAGGDEKILVVKRDILFKDESFEGFLPLSKFKDYLDIIKSHKEFMWRSEMETNPSYKQIIPYIVFCFEDKFFLMQRRSTASETRLQSKYSLGIGGHIRQDDLVSDDIFDWAKREFYEEINYSGRLKVRLLGLVNDDASEVGRVHLGFVIILDGDSSNISIKSELKSGQLLPMSDCIEYYQNMETWSQLVLDHLNRGI